MVLLSTQTDIFSISYRRDFLDQFVSYFMSERAIRVSGAAETDIGLGQSRKGFIVD